MSVSAKSYAHLLVKKCEAGEVRDFVAIELRENGALVLVGPPVENPEFWAGQLQVLVDEMLKRAKHDGETLQ